MVYKCIHRRNIGDPIYYNEWNFRAPLDSIFNYICNVYVLNAKTLQKPSNNNYFLEVVNGLYLNFI